MIKKKKPRFWGKKAVKNTFPQQKKHYDDKKAQKNTFCEDCDSLLHSLAVFVQTYAF